MALGGLLGLVATIRFKKQKRKFLMCMMQCSVNELNLPNDATLLSLILLSDQFVLNSTVKLMEGISMFFFCFFFRRNRSGGA
jgi:hypothetical protein